MLGDILSQTYFGNTLGQFFTVALILIITAIVAKAIYFFFKTYVSILTKYTKTKFDDILVDILEEPIVYLFIVFGIWFSIDFLTLTPKAITVFDDIIKVLVTINVSYFIYKFVDVVIQSYLIPFTEKSKSKLDDQLVPILRKSIKVAIVVITFVIVLNNFGYNVTSLIAGLGIGGLAVALAAKDTLANIFGSISIFTDKPFQISDKVSVGGVSGIVEEVGLRSTRIKTYDGTLVTVPNAKIIDSFIENVSAAESKKVSFNIGLTYDTSSKKMETAISTVKDILKKHKLVADNYRAHFTAFGDFSLNLSIVYWIASSDFAERMQTTHDVNMAIKQEFDKKKIEMAFPTQTIELKR